MCEKRKKNKKKKKTKKLSQFLKSHISGTLEAISLKFGMWSAEGGGSVHSKNRLVSSRQHRAMEVRKLHFLSFSQYTHGCYAPASWAARHTTVCLDIVGIFYRTFQKCHNPCAHAIISHNSPSTDQTNLHYLNICYTTLFLVPDNVVSFRKIVSTNLRQSKLMPQWHAYIFCSAEVIM